MLQLGPGAKLEDDVVLRCCADALRAVAAGILLSSVDGHPTNRPLARREGPVTGDLGIALNEPYYFVRPGGSLSSIVDTERLGLVPGAYTYTIAVAYYRCAEIVDGQRLKNEREVREMMFRGQGELVWPSGTAAASE